MSRRLRFWLPVGLALVLAVVLTIGAVAVLRAGASGGAGEGGGLTGLGEAMIGGGDDRDLRDALARFRGRTAGLEPDEALGQNAEIEARLARLARTGEPAQRSLAANVNGILLVEDAGLGAQSAARFLQLALESFREAVTLDPANEDAKYNLELLVALLERGAGRPGGAGGSQGSSGAGSSPEGSGY